MPRAPILVDHACGRAYDTGARVDVTAAAAGLDPVEFRLLERVVCAQDMGVVVNPDGATMQVEGCAVFDATGARLYRLPMTPACVKAALDQGKGK